MLVADRECGPEARAAIQRQYVDKVLALYHPAAAKAGASLSELGEAVDAHNRQIEEVLGEGARRGPRDAVEAAIAALGAADPEHRMKAAWELGNSGDARARESLFQALADPDEGVSRMAATGLATVGAADHKEKILGLLREQRPLARCNAAFLIGKIGDKSLRPALEDAYRTESDPEVKFALEDALVALR
jgi:HEAT repeat protein